MNGINRLKKGVASVKLWRVMQEENSADKIKTGDCRFNQNSALCLYI